MKRWIYILFTAAAILYVIIVFYILFILFPKLTQINPTIGAALLTGSVTIIGYFIVRFVERQKAIEQQIREKKLPIYEEFISFIFKELESAKSKKPLPASFIHDFLLKVPSKSLLWFPDDVLKAYNKWKHVEHIQGQDEANLIKQFLTLEELLLAMRKDIGLDSKDLEKGDLLRVFINDIDDHLKSK